MEIKRKFVLSLFLFYPGRLGGWRQEKREKESSEKGISLASGPKRGGLKNFGSPPLFGLRDFFRDLKKRLDRGILICYLERAF